jgi:hypothetical protein
VSACCKPFFPPLAHYRDAIIRVDYPEIGAAHIVNSVKIQFMNFGTQATLAEKLVLR